jgi:hypothetical protein
LTAVAVAALLAACGGESSADSNERAGTYRLEVVDTAFPAKQKLGQTSLLRMAVRNTGGETVPALTVTISVGGREGRNASLPFGVGDPQPGLAQADRPVWVLAETYPRFAGSDEPGGATTSNEKTFSFGPLQPNATARVVWKLSAVREGDWKVVYRVGAGLGTQVKAETASGGEPGGTILAEISAALPEVEVTDDGEVVEAGDRGAGGSE